MRGGGGGDGDGGGEECVCGGAILNSTLSPPEWALNKQ